VTPPFDARPIVVALAGPNGAGKTTFYEAHLQRSGLRFVNADELARELGVDPYAAAEVAKRLSESLVKARESFVFETVFSDPVGEKLRFLKLARAQGYTVVLCFIGLEGSDLSEERVAMLRNLAKAIRELPHVLVYDNSDLAHPFRKVAEFDEGKRVGAKGRLPAWLR
jgi:predicted ABC-type ATPase